MLSVDQCQLQALQFSVHLIHLLSILLKYNGFAGIQEAVVDQTVSKPLNSNKLFLVQVWLWEVLWRLFSIQLLSWSSLVVIYNPLSISHHHPIEKWLIFVT